MKSKFLKILNKKLAFSRQVFVALGLIAALGTGAVYVIASDGGTVAYGGTSSLVGPDSVCKKITDSSGTGLSVYIPTASIAEWQSFYGAPPSGVTAAICTCALPWGGTITDGSSATAYLNTSSATCPNESRVCTDTTLSGTYTNLSCLKTCTLPWGGTIASGASATGFLNSSSATCPSQTRTCTNGTLSGTYTFGSCLKTCTTPWGATLNSGSSVTAYLSTTFCTAETRTCTNGSLTGSYTLQSCTCSGKSCSDVRLKKDIAPLSQDSGLSAIMKLNPVTFHWKDVLSDKKDGEQIGFIAQQVEKVFPDVIVTSSENKVITLPDGTQESISNPKGMNYSALVVPLVKSVQELKAENDSLKAQNAALEARLSRLEQEILK